MRRWPRLEAKKPGLEDIVAKLTSKIDQTAATTSAQRVAEVKEVQKELAQEQAGMDQIRSEENSDFLDYFKAKGDTDEDSKACRVGNMVAKLEKEAIVLRRPRLEAPEGRERGLFFCTFSCRIKLAFVSILRFSCLGYEPSGFEHIECW